MKLLFVANVSDLYGASRSLLRLAGQLAGDGHEVQVILPSDGPLRGRLEAAGATAVVHRDLPVLTRRALRSPWGCAGLLSRVPASTLRLMRHIGRFRPDVVHTNSAVVFTPGLAARLAGRKHVWHMREFLADVSPVWHAYQWLIHALASRIVCNSQAVAGQFHGAIRRKKVTVIYNGIPPDDLAPPPETRLQEFKRRHRITGVPVIGVVGRINLEQKGQDVFVRAAAALADKFPEAGFVVAGSPYPGNEEHGRRLDRLIDDLKLRGRVASTGDVSDLTCLHSSLDVCVLPARKPEGLGNVLIEAMALGKPVVGAAIGGIPEIIEDGVNGYLVEPGNVSSLARALERLLADPAQRRRMGDAGKRRFHELFEFDECCKNLLALYASLQRQPVGAPAADLVETAR